MIFLATTALAAVSVEPPVRPAVPEPKLGECSRNFSFVTGRPVDSGLLDLKGIPMCGGILVPTSAYEDLLLTQTWGEAVHDRYRIDMAAMEDRVASAEERVTYWKKMADRPVPLLQRPGVGIGVGAAVGVVAVLGGALAVRAVSEVPLFP